MEPRYSQMLQDYTQNLLTRMKSELEGHAI